MSPHCRRALSDKYDAVHSHEEGSWFGVVLAALLGVPHLYDMHSSLPQQLTNFAYSDSRLVKAVFDRLERFVVRRSRVVIVICPQLEEVVRGIDAGVPSVLIENAPGSGDAPVEGSGLSVRRTLGLDARTPMVLYTGTFEAYQGLDLLFACDEGGRCGASGRAARACGRPSRPGDRGGTSRSCAPALPTSRFSRGSVRRKRSPRFSTRPTCSSRRAVWERTRRLKIYQYLRSGRAIVATRLLTHTQVLDDDVAVLTEATPVGFAAGILAAIEDPDRARAIGASARQLAETKYSYEAYLARTRQACAHLFGDRAPEMAGGVA